MVEHIQKHDESKDRNTAKGLISLISSFSLDLQGLTQTLNTHFVAENIRLNQALELLSHLSIKMHPKRTKLSAAHLDFILRQVNSHPNQPVIQIIKELRLANGTDLSSYFVRDLLENYDKAGIPDPVNIKIKQYFNEGQQGQIAKILLRFSAHGDALHYDGLVDKLISITKSLSPVEKNLFLKKLSSNHGLYSPLQPLSHEHNDFISLLNSIIACRSIDGFMSFIASERHCQQISGLSKKASLFLQTIEPKVKAIHDPVIALVDLIPSLHTVLLKTPLEQLSTPSTVVHEKLPVFVKQEATLDEVLNSINNNKLINFERAKTDTRNFMSTAGLEDVLEFSDYHQTLTALNSITDLNFWDNFLWLPWYLNKFVSASKNTPKIQDLVQQYPGIGQHYAYLALLRTNPKFIASLATSQFKTALYSSDLNKNEDKLRVVLGGVEKILKEIHTFSEKTKAIQKALISKKTDLNRYSTVFVNLYKKINTIVKLNPSSKKQFLELYDRYLSHYSPARDGELLKYLSTFVTTLEKSFASIEDKNIVLSLCMQFSGDSHAELKPERLIDLLKEIESVDTPHRPILLKMALALINNEKGYTLESFSNICNLVRQHPVFAEKLQSFYKKAPFPKINHLMEWHAAAPIGDGYAVFIQEKYNAFSKYPCPREDKNGFNTERARAQLSKFVGFNSETLNVDAFRDKTLQMRLQTPEALLTIFNKAGRENDDETLVAAAAELMYRSKGRDGSSMEINTTQYLAILSSLKTPGHVTSQIGTGEGKSRIMMISIACQFAKGRTVDFVTSDAQLATRDFVEYQAYFEMFGAQASMVFAHSDPATYKIRGINFSDPSNLSLFRNKARSLGQGERVIDPLATNRALLLDEADKTYFDVADTRFNFSAEGDEATRGMEWVYPLLMEYFSQEHVQLSKPFQGKMTIKPIELYYQNVDLSREKFMEFAYSKRSKQDLMRLKALSNAQIEQWQVSAVTAAQLKFNEDFVIEPDVLVTTPKGPKISSEAQLLFANRVAKSSKFSFGVQQCLHARLNLARNQLDGLKDGKLKTALERCEQPFYVADEKQIIYSSTSKNLLDDYAQGTVKGVTGTSGELIERHEAQKLYRGMQFIDVPRHAGIHRKDRAIRLTKNSQQQFETLVEQIKQARRKNQPILIITENDQESENLFKKIKVRFERVQHIHSQLSSKQEKELIKKAGYPGQITISTDMIGRGTDIILQENAQDDGLHVMLTYLPRTRDLAQIIGRSGRFGAKGEASVFLDKERLKQQLGKTTLTDGFYANTEAYIRREQASIDRLKQCERLFKNQVGDFKQGLTQEFFEKMLKNVDREHHKVLLPMWTKFFDESDKAWNEIWPRLQKELRAPRINFEDVQRLLNGYQGEVQKCWNTLRRQVAESSIICQDRVKACDKLTSEVPQLLVSETIKGILNRFNYANYRMDKWKLYDQYEPGHDGRAVEYSSWYIPVIASLKGYANLLPFIHFEDARKPFANFIAWLEGHGRLFPNLRASEDRAKIILSTTLGILGAGAFAALILTGVLSPVGMALLGYMMYSCFFGFSGGFLVGYGIGYIIDQSRSSHSTSNAIALGA